MKRYLMVACAAAALVGCAENRGGVDYRSGSETGRSEEMQSTNSNWNTNSSNVTNESTGAPGSSNERNTSQDNPSAPTEQK